MRTRPDREWPSVVVTPAIDVPMRGDLTIEVQNDNFTADQLAVMGTGLAAEVKTVREILS